MNREILFRGKRIDNGEWVEGYLRFGPDMKDAYIGCFMDYIDEGLHTDYFEFRVFSVTIGQYTGLTDKNGKKVFDGDILRFGERILLVRWNYETFQWQAKTVAGYDLIPPEIQGDAYWTDIDLGWVYAKIPTLWKMTTEVIGNIHDNPELLEGD